MSKIITKSLLLLPIVLLYSCSSKVYETVYPTLVDGKYDSEFPYRNCSEELEMISKSIKKINCLAFYQTFVFDEAQDFKKGTISQTILDQAISTRIYDESASGTATIIDYTNRAMTFITCAHIVDFQDTIYQYFENGNLYSVSIKVNQKNFIQDIPAGNEIEILYTDEKSDIAFLGRITDEDASFPEVLEFPFGDATELEWGSFVYVMGFPKGHQMLTKGIVSNPARIKKGVITIDAVFNRGFSGGLVLAIRDGVPNFEIIGVASSSDVDYYNVLSPYTKNYEILNSSSLPYTGESYIRLVNDINYGITYATPINDVIDIYRKNKEVINNQGYVINRLLK